MQPRRQDYPFVFLLPIAKEKPKSKAQFIVYSYFLSNFCRLLKQQGYNIWDKIFVSPVIIIRARTNQKVYLKKNQKYQELIGLSRVLQFC